VDRGAARDRGAEWEIAAKAAKAEALGMNLLGTGRLHPEPAPDNARAPSQMLGDCWEWTMSAYGAYPGYSACEGALGEYNGKFMCNQIVLRGGSCFTPSGHIRTTYRNFFPPETRFQMSGIRLARSAS
jgi:formylglycine-generating enzyme required for sulfatase activity